MSGVGAEGRGESVLGRLRTVGLYVMTEIMT